MDSSTTNGQGQPMPHVPIPVENVRAALSVWGIEPESADFEELERGATAEVWKVTCNRGVFVAKYAYDDQDKFELGLRAAEVAQEAGLRTAAPLRTNDGQMTEMLEWPSGHWHPLALLEFVAGRQLGGDEPGAVEIFARIHGTLQAALAEGISDEDPGDPFEYLGYIENPSGDLGEFTRLDDLVAGVAARARRFQEDTPMTIAPCIWDGPEIVIDAEGTPGLLDFGFSRTMPVLHSLANRSLHFGLGDEDLPGRFVELYLRHFPLRDEELASLEIFRHVSIAIYAKYQAGRLAAGGLVPEQEAGIRAYVEQHMALLS